MEDGLLAASPRRRFLRVSERPASGGLLSTMAPTPTLEGAIDRPRGLPVGRLQPHYGRA
jgi:hypothetical protein